LAEAQEKIQEHFEQKKREALKAQHEKEDKLVQAKKDADTARMKAA